MQSLIVTLAVLNAALVSGFRSNRMGKGFSIFNCENKVELFIFQYSECAPNGFGSKEISR